MEIRPIVLGTAGHIDHGKSTLVRALTGVDPDRLKEEKERGLTIDLGFAPLQLSDGRTVGVVDVPGHERFVKNMVAGASGIDFVMLVVAADDGVMPQTREHLAIMQLLGVRHGLVALTKVDTVEEGLVDLAEEDVRETLRWTFLEEAPLVRVSAPKDLGLDALRAAIEAVANAIEPRSADRGVFRMPIQRVFSKQGFGTVVTGIPVSGRCKLGDVLEIQPSGARGKVRSLQAYRETTDAIRAGHSSAINLSDIDHREVHRGAVVATPGLFRPATLLGARIEALPGLARPIENRTRVRVHTGTAEALGEVVLLDTPQLEPGGTALAQLRFEDPVVVAPGDRFVFRLETPVITLGGGVVLEESRWRLKRFKSFVVDELVRQEQSLESLRDHLRVTLERAAGFVTVAELVQAAKQPVAVIREALRSLQTDEQVTPDASGDRWLAACHLARAAARIESAATEFFTEAPHLSQVEALELRRRTELEPGLFQAALAACVSAGTLVAEAGGRVRVAGRDARLAEGDRDLARRLAELLRGAGLQPPSPDELASSLAIPVPRLRTLLAALVDAGEVVRVGGDLFASAAEMERARAEVVANCERNGELDIPQLRDALGTSRKFLIPILEWFDARGVTLRQGPRRVLRRR